MATEIETTREDGNRLLTGGVALLGAATGLAMGSVFAGGTPTLKLVLAGTAAVLVGAALERRHVALSAVAAAAGLAVSIGLLVFPDTTALGLPTRATAVEVGQALGRIAVDASKETAPAPAMPSLMLASVAAVWAAVYAAHTLATRGASGVLALVPPAALVAFAGVVTGDSPHPVRVALFLAACFVVLFGSGLLQLRFWGPVLVWPGSRRLTQAPASQARRLALAATAVAVILPGLLPGFRASPLLDLTRGGLGGTSVSPIVDIRPSLQRNPAVELFQVRADQPAYWRLLSLERFDGRLWTSGDLDVLSGTTIPPGSGLADQLTPQQPEGAPLEQEFAISGLTTPWLPAALLPQRVRVDGDIRFDPSRHTLVREGGTGPGLRYLVTSQVVVPSPKQLDRAVPPTGLAVADEYTRLPPNVPQRIRDIARRLTEDEPTAYRKILAIQGHLRSYVYDEDAPAGHGVNDMVFFLEQSRRGYCEQFAASMAVLLRTLGYPSRVAVGFLPGDRDDDGRWRVTTEETHAWVEVHFPEFGWLAFEPTPSRLNPVARPYAHPIGPVSGVGPVQGEEAFVRGAFGRAEELDERLSRLDPGAVPVAAPQRSRPWGALAAGLGALLLLAALAIPASKALGRRLALSRAGSAGASAVAAFLVLQAGAAEVGHRRREGETVREFGWRLREALGLPGDALAQVTEPATAALYSSRGVVPAQARASAVASRRLLREIRRRVGLPRSILGAFWPSRPV